MNDLRLKVLELRKNGLSLNQIVNRLGVAKSTVWYWTKNIELAPEQRKVLYTHYRKNWGSNSAENGAKRRKKSLDQGQEDAEKRSTPLHVAGCMLFWAEGTKNRNSFRFTNCDINMHRLFVRFLKEYYLIPNEDFCLWVQYYDDQDVELIYKYWLDQLGLHGAKICNPYRKKNNSKRVVRYQNGILTLKIKKGTKLVHRVWGSIQHYASFDDSSCLKSY